MVIFICILSFVVSLIIMCNGAFIFGLFLLIITSVIFIIERASKKRSQINDLSPEERQKYYDDQTINYTILVGEDSANPMENSAVRGAIGGNLLGKVGLIAEH